MQRNKTITLRSECPLTYLLDLLGDKWSLLILRDMIFEGKVTFTDFLSSDEKIATNILKSRLEQLTDKGLIIRGGSVESRTKILYALTDKAIDLFPMILEAIYWGDKHSPVSGPKPLACWLVKNKDLTIKEFREKIFAERAENMKKMLSLPAEV